MAITFKKATKKQAKLRLALLGPAGAGKTYTALAIGSHLGKPIAVIDTERGSASKYSDAFEFDVLELESFSPLKYVDAIKAAEEGGYGTLIIDSLSHAWTGKDGALDQVEKARTRGGNGFGVWKDVTPQQNALVEAILQAKMHIVVTMRTKMEYVQEKDERTGKTIVRKIGLQPVQREGLEYEFDVVGDIDQENNFIVTKTRCPALSQGIFKRAGKDVADILNGWLADGTPVTHSAAAEAGATDTTGGPYDHLVDALNLAKNQEDLAVVSREIVSAKKSGYLTDDQVSKLRQLYATLSAGVQALCRGVTVTRCCLAPQDTTQSALNAAVGGLLTL